ncbi:MAG: methyltransferase domain-containing protein [Thermoleophilaceae bacterium]|nr:methyltransferase domain-containing protein [Thermoleophilaceae bacterium]
MPAAVTMARTVCPACGGGARAAMEVSGHAFRRCGTCASLFLECPPAEVGAQYEGRGYFVDAGYGPPGGGSFHGYRDYLADRHEITEKFEQILGHVERLVDPGRLLDVGAGPGFMVAAARDRGWDAAGLDLNGWAAAYARDELAVEVRQASLEDAGLGAGELDAVSMLDLIEHVTDPHGLVAEAARVLRPGGVLAILTPDAGSPVSRALGARWPEVQRAPEHIVLFSVEGLAALLRAHGFEVEGWHSTGKRSTAETLFEDLSPAAPAAARLLRPLVRGRALGRLRFELDPRTKLCLYAVRRREGELVAGGKPRRVPRHAPAVRSTERAVLEELETLARARRLGDWMFEQLAGAARGRVAEVGAGIGTFSERLLAAGVEELLQIEPEPGCAEVLERRFEGDPRVTIAREQLPGSPTLRRRAGEFDLVLCQNVLEHIEDHEGAVAVMAGALRPGGELSLLVPAHPRLFGPLDAAYGHHRRYTKELLSRLVQEAGLEVEGLHHFNALGIPGWWLKNLTGASGIGPLALGAYELAVAAWRPLERRLCPPFGLSLIVRGRRPAPAR